MRNVTCPTCGRTVLELNLNDGSGTCLFCDVNGENSDL